MRTDFYGNSNTCLKCHLKFFSPLCSCIFAQFEIRGFYVDMPSQLEEHANVAMSNMCRLQQHKYFLKSTLRGPLILKELFLASMTRQHTYIEREIQEGFFFSLTCEEIGKCSPDMTHPCQKDLPPLFSRNRNVQAAKFWTLLRSIKSCVTR